MNFYLITQEKTREQELRKKYLWARQFARDGKQIEFWNLKKVKKGDVIFHNNKDIKYIDAISFAIEDGKEYSLLSMPPEDRIVYGDGCNEGYIVRLDTEPLEYPIETKNLLRYAYNSNTSKLVDINGNKKEAYLLEMKLEEVLYCIEIAKNHGDKSNYLWKIIEYFGIEYIDNYTDNEKDKIEQTLNAANNDKNSRNHFITSPTEAKFNCTETSKIKSPKRDFYTAAKALAFANYECEYDRNHPTFLRKNNPHNYTEPHHLIPLSQTGHFIQDNTNMIISLDVTNNIVSLCSHCHNLLHYGRIEEKEAVLRKLFDKRHKVLEEAGIKISFEDLKKFYK